jgi:hypothetical protein
VSFVVGDQTVIAREVGGAYPTYDRLLSADPAARTVVDRVALRAQTRRAAALVAARTARGQIAVTIRPGAISVAPHFPDQPDAGNAPDLALHHRLTRAAPHGPTRSRRPFPRGQTPAGGLPFLLRPRLG